MGLSSSTSTLDAVAEASGNNPNVLQLYLFEGREHSRKLVARPKRPGYKAVLLTVDTSMQGRCNLEIRNQFKLPSHLAIANFVELDELDADGDAIDSSFPYPRQHHPKQQHCVFDLTTFRTPAHPQTMYLLRRVPRWPKANSSLRPP